LGVDGSFPTPEDAAMGSDPDARVAFVDYSPNGAFAIVFLEYNPDSRPTPYAALCERSGDGWTRGIDGSGGGMGWMITHEHGGSELGVTWRWNPPYAEWNTPPPS
jgi:hypothetical protein